MNHWWKRKEMVELGDYTKEEVEDVTGCIPWFLEKCVVQGEIHLDHGFFTEIYLEALLFEADIQKKMSWGEISTYATIVLPPRLC